MSLSDLKLLADVLNIPFSFVLVIAAVWYLKRRIERSTRQVIAGAEALKAMNTFIRFLDRHYAELAPIPGYREARDAWQDRIEEARLTLPREH